MSGSNRSKYLAFAGWVIAGILLLGGATFYIFSLTTEQHEYETIATQNTNYQSDTSISPKSGTKVQFVTEASPNRPSDTEYAARDHDRGEYDLEAQQTMALWTAAMGKAAIIGVALSALGVGLIFTTFRATQHAAASSSKTLSAFIAKERAILQVEGAHNTVALRTLKKGVSVTFKNVGTAPATMIGITWAYNKTNTWPDFFTNEVEANRLCTFEKPVGSPCLDWDADDVTP